MPRSKNYAWMAFKLANNAGMNLRFGELQAVQMKLEQQHKKAVRELSFIPPSDEEYHEHVMRVIRPMFLNLEIVKKALQIAAERSINNQALQDRARERAITKRTPSYAAYAASFS